MDHLLKNAINNLEVLAREKGPLLPDRGRLIHSFLDCRLASAFAHPGDGFNTNVHTRKRNEFRKRRSTECPQVISLRGDARRNGPSADASYISERGGIRGLSPITHIGEGKARLDLPRRMHAELVCCGVFKDIAGWSPPPNPEGDYPLCSWLFRCRGRGCESRSIRSVSVFRTEESVGLGRTFRSLLCGLKVMCGKIHNPSCQVDPDYWRFFVSRGSIERFAKLVGSWHPRKARWLDEAFNRAPKPRRNSKPRRSR